MSQETLLAQELPLHVVVLHHGLWGNSAHMAGVVRELERGNRNEENLYFLNVSANHDHMTYDGIDILGLRAIDELHAWMESSKAFVKKISFVGLVLRFAIGKLYESGFFAGGKIQPVQYVSIATPHLGVLHSSVLKHVAPSLLSRSGEQIVLKDHYTHNLPLLKCMALPSLPFFKGLSLFEKIITLANIVNDRSVGYESAVIEKENKFFLYGSKSVQDDRYPSIRVLDESTMLPNGKIALPPYPRSRFLFYALLPIFIPIALCRLSIAAFKSRRRITRYDTSPKWIEKLEDLIGDSPNVSSTTLVAEDESLLDTEREVVDLLNLLPWIKIHVLITELNSHGGIVLRQSAFRKFADELDPCRNVLEYLANEVFVY
ncbi:hypothetical protein HDU91_003561 [Kappamyces sp. JEL0680]|nr:hypothetical protein HDU91_003561 [Kappamyces sp. JEL0680]